MGQDGLRFGETRHLLEDLAGKCRVSRHVRHMVCRLTRQSELWAIKNHPKAVLFLANPPGLKPGTKRSLG